MTTNMTITLSDQASLIYDPTWECQVCQSHFLFLVIPAEGETSKFCTMCEFTRAGRDTITVQGWALVKAKNQVVCSRIPRKQIL